MIKMKKSKINMHGNDTMVECSKCGRREFLMFANGLKNGWTKCCGYTMTIKVCPHSAKAINKAVAEAIDAQIPKRQ